jgi:hypothetical protein
MPHEPDCAQKQRDKFLDSCKAAGLDKSDLSMTGVAYSSFGVIFGVFTSLVYQNVSGDVPQNKLRQFTILVLCINLIIFMALRTFINSRLCFAMYRHSEDWFKVVLAISRSIKLFSMFLVTNFITSAFLKEWLSSHFSAIETISAIWIIFLLINFVQVVASKT